MLRLEGSFPAVATPFRSGALDERAYRELCAWLLAEGCAGLVPCGTTGETPTLSRAEQDACIRIAVEEGRRAGKPVIAGAGTNDTRTTIERVREVKALGADAALVVTPWYNKPTQGGLIAHYAAVNDAVPSFPIVVYVVPGRTGGDLLPETYGKLCARPEIVAVKEATASMQRVVEIKEQVGDRLQILSGDDFTIHPLIALGGTGVISVSANVAPKLLAELVAASRRGDNATAAALQVRLQPLHRALFLESNPIPVKAALHLMGRFADEVRLPLVPASAQTRGKLAEALRVLGIEVQA